MRRHLGIDSPKIFAGDALLDDLFEKTRVPLAFRAHFGVVASAQRAAFGEIDGIDVELLAQRDEMRLHRAAEFIGGGIYGDDDRFELLGQRTGAALENFKEEFFFAGDVVIERTFL